MKPSDFVHLHCHSTYSLLEALPSPEEIVLRAKELGQNAVGLADKGYMLDGFPRTEQQAKDLDKILQKLGKPLEYAVYLESSLPVIIKRLTGRRVCRNCGALYHILNKPPKRKGICDECGGEIYQRADDNEETIKTRMDVYMQSTEPIIAFYQAQGKLKKVDADKDSREVQRILMKLFGA